MYDRDSASGTGTLGNIHVRGIALRIGQAIRYRYIDHGTTAVPRVVRDSQKSEVGFLDDFRPRITMGNPIVTEILGFSDVGFSKNEKISAKKSKK